MNNRKGPVGLLITVPLLLTGCATADANIGRSTPTASTSVKGAASAATPGSSTTGSHHMSMSPGESMAGMTSTTTPPSAALPPESRSPAAQPSKQARMICESEIRRNVATLMGLSTPPPSKTSWADHLYTCTYQLPVGPLVLSVKELPDVAAARTYFNATRQRLGLTKPLAGIVGLGLPAYENKTGTVLFLKDNMILEVNATALPRQVGPQDVSPAALAYTVATGVLACWTEHPS